MDPDLGELVSAWLGDEIAADRREALAARLRADAGFRAAVAEELRLIGMLKVTGTQDPWWLRFEDRLGRGAKAPPPVSALARPADMADSVAARIRDLPLPGRTQFHLWRAGGVAAVVLLGLAAVLLLGRPNAVPPGEGPPVAPGPAAVALVARLDGAEWAGSRGPGEGEAIPPGPLALRTGTATLTLLSGVKVHAEGPAKFDLLPADGVVCRRGLLRIDVPAGATGFTAAVPAGRITNAAAELAVAVDAGGSDVAVIDGRSDVSVLDPTGRSLRTETLVSGQAVRIDPVARRMVIAPTGRMAQPVKHEPLPLGPDYPRAVLANGPVGYWRFETLAGGVVPNEVAGKPGLRLFGRAALTTPAGALDLPPTPATAPKPPSEWVISGALSNGPVESAGADFTVECWVRPTGYRRAAVVGLLADTDTRRLDAHALLLEQTDATAPLSGPSSRRFHGLFRGPGAKPRGVDLYAAGAYRLNQWQHVVARRAGGRCDLYVNGALAAAAEEPTAGAFPRGWVLVGALFAARDGISGTGRPFVGQVDEVAVYDRALPVEAIRRHSQLATVAAPK